jgi:hypothetical protein
MIVGTHACCCSYRQMQPALERCERTLGQKPKQIVADGGYPITRRCKPRQRAVWTSCGLLVDFYGSWQDSWKPTELDAQGRSAEFLASAFPYNAKRDCFTCPAGKILTHHALLNRGNGVHTHVYRAPKAACPNCPLRGQCAPLDARPAWRRSITRLEEPATTTVFKAKMATEEARQIYAKRSQNCGVPACLDQRALRLTPVPVPEPPEGNDGSYLGVPQLQPDKVVQYTAQVQSGNSVRLGPALAPHSPTATPRTTH